MHTALKRYRFPMDLCPLLFRYCEPRNRLYDCVSYLEIFKDGLYINHPDLPDSQYFPLSLVFHRVQVEKFIVQVENPIVQPDVPRWERRAMIPFATQNSELVQVLSHLDELGTAKTKENYRYQPILPPIGSPRNVLYLKLAQTCQFYVCKSGKVNQVQAPDIRTRALFRLHTIPYFASESLRISV